MNKYINKNKSFDCRGNEEIDQLLCLIEANSVLSQSFSQRIINICLVILTNLDSNVDWVESEIADLKVEMNWLSIFSERFISVITGQLLLGMSRQITLNKKES